MTKLKPKSGDATGGALHLARQSALRKKIQEDSINPSMLIVEDESMDAHFIETPLRRLFGDKAKIKLATTVTELAEALKTGTFDVVLLDDRLDLGATVETTLPMIRATSATLPVIVVSHLITRGRKIELQRLGVPVILMKDEIDSYVIGEAVLKALGHELN
jgi:DNA-binding NtrC family response regulator